MISWHHFKLMQKYQALRAQGSQVSIRGWLLVREGGKQRGLPATPTGEILSRPEEHAKKTDTRSTPPLSLSSSVSKGSPLYTLSWAEVDSLPS